MPCWINNPPSNGGTDSFKVVDTNPSDGDNIVPVDLAEIIVKFNKNRSSYTGCKFNWYLYMVKR